MSRCATCATWAGLLLLSLLLMLVGGDDVITNLNAMAVSRSVNTMVERSERSFNGAAKEVKLRQQMAPMMASTWAT